MHFTKMNPLEIIRKAFMGHPRKAINLQVHFSLEKLVFIHIFKLHLYIAGIE